MAEKTNTEGNSLPHFLQKLETFQPMIAATFVFKRQEPRYTVLYRRTWKTTSLQLVSFAIKNQKKPYKFWMCERVALKRNEVCELWLPVFIGEPQFTHQVAVALPISSFFEFFASTLQYLF